MMPYGYHNSEINHTSREERTNAREAIRQAKLVRRAAQEASRRQSAHTMAPKPGLVGRLLETTRQAASFAYLRRGTVD